MFRKIRRRYWIVAIAVIVAGIATWFFYQQSLSANRTTHFR
jgi:hypothetical protein